MQIEAKKIEKNNICEMTNGNILNNIDMEHNINININNDNDLNKIEEVEKKKIGEIKIRKNLKPIIKWSGGKGDELDEIMTHIPKKFKTYIEPFVGGGAVYFYLNPEKSVINDVHEELIAFYKEIKNGNGEKIYEFMENHPNDEKEYYKVRDQMEINNDFDKACKFYYLRKTCFRGMMRYNKNGGFNIPFGKYKTINYNELKNKDYTEILANTEIYNEDFEYIFKNYNSKKNFMFLDPPYDSKFTDYGYCQFTKEHHERLAKCFKNTKIKCLMVIGKTELISDLYKDYIVGEFEKKYKFKIHSGRVGNEINTTHLIIKNYE